MPERSLKTFLRGGCLLGIPAGLCYAIGSTVLRNGVSINALLTIDFLTLLVIGTVAGFILAGAWELLLEITFRRYEYNNTDVPEPPTGLRFIIVEGGLRFGLAAGFFVDFARTFGRHGIPLDPDLWGSFLFWLGFDLFFFFLVGCVFGFFMWGTLKILRAQS